MKDLTPKQREVLELAALGKTQVEIGLILHLPPPTVKSRFEAAKKKLGATNKALAVARYVKEKIKSEI